MLRRCHRKMAYQHGGIEAADHEGDQRDAQQAAIENGVVRLVRSVDLGSLEARPADELLNDMLADIFPTQVFVSDSLGQPVDQLVLCGFGEYLVPALERFPKELGCAAKPLESSQGPVGRRDAGMWGYLSLS